MFFPPVYFNRDYPEYSCLLLVARPDYLQIPLGLYPGYRVFDFSFSFLFFTYDAYTSDARRMPEWTTRWSTIVRCPLCHLMPNFRIVSLRPSNRSRNKFCQYETIVYRASLGNAISSFFPVLIPVCSRNDPRSSSFSSLPGSIRGWRQHLRSLRIFVSGHHPIILCSRQPIANAFRISSRVVGILMTCGWRGQTPVYSPIQYFLSFFRSYFLS